jgi:hypothetical protein
LRNSSVASTVQLKPLVILLILTSGVLPIRSRMLSWYCNSNQSQILCSMAISCYQNTLISSAINKCPALSLRGHGSGLPNPTLGSSTHCDGLLQALLSGTRKQEPSGMQTRAPVRLQLTPSHHEAGEGRKLRGSFEEAGGG